MNIKQARKLLRQIRVRVMNVSVITEIRLVQQLQNPSGRCVYRHKLEL